MSINRNTHAHTYIPISERWVLFVKSESKPINVLPFNYIIYNTFIASDSDLTRRTHHSPIGAYYGVSIIA